MVSASKNGKKIITISVILFIKFLEITVNTGNYENLPNINSWQISTFSKFISVFAKKSRKIVFINIKQSSLKKNFEIEFLKRQDIISKLIKIMM